MQKEGKKLGCTILSKMISICILGLINKNCTKLVKGLADSIGVGKFLGDPSVLCTLLKTKDKMVEMLHDNKLLAKLKYGADSYNFIFNKNLGAREFEVKMNEGDSIYGSAIDDHNNVLRYFSLLTMYNDDFVRLMN
jgi:hypothetical protein